MTTPHGVPIADVITKTGIARIELTRRIESGDIRTTPNGNVATDEVRRLHREREARGLTVEEATERLGYSDPHYTYRLIRNGRLAAWAEEDEEGRVRYKVLPIHLERFTARHPYRAYLGLPPVKAEEVAVPVSPADDTSVTVREAMALLGTESRSTVNSLLARGHLERAPRPEGEAHDTTTRITRASIERYKRDKAAGLVAPGGYRPAKDAPDGRRYRVTGGQGAVKAKREAVPA